MDRLQKAIVILLSVCLAQSLAAQPARQDSSAPTPNAALLQNVNELNRLAAEYISRTDGKSDNLSVARHYAERALSLANPNQYAKGTAMAWQNIGLAVKLAYNESDQKALDYFMKALPYFEIASDQKGLTDCQMNIADCLHMLGRLDSAIAYYDSAYHGLLNLHDSAAAIVPLTMKGHCYYDHGNYKMAYEVGVTALAAAKKTRDTVVQIMTLVHLANLFLGAGLPETTVDYIRQALTLYPGTLDESSTGKLPEYVFWGLLREGEAFVKLNQLDSAKKIAAIIKADTTDGDSQLFFGHLYFANHETLKAFVFFKRGLELEKYSGHEIGIARHADELGKTYLLMDDLHQALFYGNLALSTARKIPALLEMRNAAGTLRDIYSKAKNNAQAVYYGQLYRTLNDSLAPEEYQQKLSLLEIENQLQFQKQQATYLSRENAIKERLLDKNALVAKILVAGITCLLLLAFFVIRNNGQKRKANKQLKLQKVELETTLSQLKATQNQLIQSEKMASLGQLTAGIAHEIQNPLNFVNNFSEVNEELVKELNEELDKADLTAARQLAHDIAQNEQKINHHGKRADAIVKGMLLHSQLSSGQKEPTDINLLVDEYLRLSYHACLSGGQGIRARDKTFTASLHTDYDTQLPNINIIPQEIGRALLNIFNNAFYAVAEKKKNTSDLYHPSVWVHTFQQDQRLFITVKDNGIGMPSGIMDKIFQPFFTTKPTGQGTGLGLSLSYDIITQSHSGILRADSQEGEFSEFIISLPLNKNR